MVTTCGYTTDPPLLCALMVVGADRILFSVDHPFSDSSQATDFLRAAPLSPGDKEKIAHTNAERLLGLVTQPAPSKPPATVSDRP
ncbi:MAG: amidohydrolase family protein [Candidatus Dormibacteria bacterium]